MFSNENVPMGLGMALMKNPQAFTAFAHMTEEQKQSIISATHSISSKQEMKAYVDKISQQG